VHELEEAEIVNGHIKWHSFGHAICPPLSS
jgi:hypothetical protein